jgi:hypothetical protein
MFEPYKVSLWLQMSAKARTVAGGLHDPATDAEAYNAMAERTAVLLARETKDLNANGDRPDT